MKHQDATPGNRLLRNIPWRPALFGAAFAFAAGASAQVVFSEDFAGGTSTAGFTIEQVAGTCTWTYDNPGTRDVSGAGFDADFAIFDSDNCGFDADSSAANLVSPAFDASSGNFLLHFDQQWRNLANQVGSVDVWNGSVWTSVYSPMGANAGYPNPGVFQTVNITDAAGGSAVAQVRFHFAGDYQWWWALDNISVEAVDCIFPSDLAVTAITTDGGTLSWTDNGSAGYEWAVTSDGNMPNDTNVVATGDGSDMNVTGLNSGTPYTAWVRADCGGGSLSGWSNGVAFITGISNDDCDGAIALTVNPDYNCGTVTPGTVAGATDSGITTTCGGTADDDVWFSFMATDTMHRISLENITGSTTDMYMALWTGDCGNLILVPNSCSDPQTMNIGGLTAGTMYYLQVYTWTSTPGQTSTFDVCVGTTPMPPANDDCDGAIALTVNPDDSCGTVTAGTVAGATDSGTSSTCSGTPNDDVWFSFSATGSTQIVSLLNITNTPTDLYMALWTGDCGSLTLVPGSCSDPNTLFADGLTAGTTYYLQVYTYSGQPGSATAFDVCVGTPPPPPANDDCDGATALTVNPDYNCGSTTPGTVAGATDSGITSTCGGTADDDVWFMFTATDTLHRISLENITGSTTDMYMALWTGDCGNLTLVPGSCSDPQTMDIGGLTVGTTYYLQVYTWTSTPGQTSAFDVCVGSEPFCQPPTDIMVESISAPDATVSFTENGAMEYQWELRASGNAGSGATGLVDAGTVTASPVNLTGLVADSLYTLYIRSICSVGDTSAWSEGTGVLDGYCSSNFTDVSYEHITNVQFAGIDNTSDGHTGGPVDYTDQVAQVEQGQTDTLRVTILSDQLDYVYAFIDWNQNNTLDDAGEAYTVIASTDQNGPHALAIAVPNDAALGQTRMRVMVAYNNDTPDPCVDQTYGEAEDYTVEVSAHVAVDDCEGVPDGPAMPGTPCISDNGFGGIWNDDCDCVENVGIEEIAATTGLAVHPNPASTELFITTANGRPVHVQVFDLVGNKVMEQDMATKLDISSLAPGGYILSATDMDGEHLRHTRFMKK